MMYFALAIFLACLLLEISAIFLLRWLHAKKGLYFLPGNKPQLSEQTRSFLLRFIENDGQGSIKMHHPELGWTSRPLGQSADQLYTFNEAGARVEKLPDIAIGAHQTILSTFGDCLTLGEKVPYADTWQSQLVSMHQDLVTLNFGVEGYGPLQCFLRYLDSLNHYPRQDLVVISYVSSNLFKPENHFRPFYAYDHGLQLGKPRAEIVGGKLEIRKNPLPAMSDYRKLLESPEDMLTVLGQNDTYFQRTYSTGAFDVSPTLRLLKMIRNEFEKRNRVFYRNGVIRPDSATWFLSLEVLSAHYDTARKHASEPILLLLPLKSELERFLADNTNPWQLCLKQLNERNIQFLDMLEVLGMACQSGQCKVADLFEGRNYSALCNQKISAALSSYLIREKRPGALDFMN